MNEQLANAGYTSMQDFNLNRPRANLNCVKTTAGDLAPYGVIGQLAPAALALDMGVMPQLAVEGDLGGALAGDFANAAPELAEDVESALASDAAPAIVDTGSSVTADATTTLADGSFSISDWNGYPDYLPMPEGPFRLLKGEEYEAARSAADAANRALRAENPGLQGWEIHEIQPVKFGGSPTAIDNKFPLPPSVHRGEVTPWWNQLQRDIE
jgi:hypothetical protein